MGDGLGVEVRDSSIRLHFRIDKEPVSKTLKVNGEPMRPTPANVKFARRVAAEIRDKIRHGTFSVAEYFPDDGTVGQGLTVGKQLDSWLESQRVSASTRKSYESAIRFWKLHVGDDSVRRLKHSDVLKALAKGGFSGKTANNYTTVFRQAMDLAVRDGVLTSNPAADVPRQKHQKPPPDPFTAAEAESIVAAVRELDDAVADMVEFWMWSGLRTGEILGLEVEQVTGGGSAVVIDRAVVRGVKETTKTDVARTVALNSIAKAALARQLARRRALKVADTHVWLDPRYGLAWADERAFRRSYWTPALKAAGVRYRRPYCCRHTYATAMLMADMKAAFCAKQMGHSVEIFHSTYARWIDGQRDSAEMALLERAISERRATIA